MFHILQKGIQELNADAGVLCGVKFRREAISQERFKQYHNAGTLKKERCCKRCYKLSDKGRAEVPAPESLEETIPTV